MKTTENNKLIAEFMGVKTISADNLRKELQEQKRNGVNFSINKEVEEDLKYHECWNWLMPVGRKIMEMLIDYPEELKKSIVANLTMFDRAGTYRAVVEFINWYNEQNRFICGICGDHVNEYTYNEEKDVDECGNCKED
jgi:hypothetical protein